MKNIWKAMQNILEENQGKIEKQLVDNNFVK